MMGCVRYYIDRVFQFLCCPDGTTVFKGDQRVSFSPERDPRCPPVRAMITESPPGVFPEWFYQVLVGGLVAIGVFVVAIFVLRRCRIRNRARD